MHNVHEPGLGLGDCMELNWTTDKLKLKKLLVNVINYNSSRVRECRQAMVQRICGIGEFQAWSEKWMSDG